MRTIPLTTLQDVINVEPDADFNQVLNELPLMLRALRESGKRDGHGDIMWPIRWRSSGEQSTLTTHCTDGSIRQTLETPTAKLFDRREIGEKAVETLSFLAAALADDGWP